MYEKKEQEQLNVFELIADLIRENSAEVRFTKVSDFQEEPLELDADSAKIKIAELLEQEDYADIQKLEGKNSSYYFSEQSITTQYANLMLLVEEKDVYRMIAEAVREESKLYPRPTKSLAFTESPFNLQEDVLEQVIESLQEQEEYQDIKETRASNGALYLYSDKYMTKQHAKGLTEWEEVLSKEIM